jgi:hypothetical protein
MTALDIFEELRFIIELLVAEQLFIWFFAKRKEHFWIRTLVTGLFFVLMTVLWAYVRSNLSAVVGSNAAPYIAVGWYIGITFLTFASLRISYCLNFSDTIFLGIAGWSLQHIEYVIINEVLALGLWQELTENLWLYGAVCAVSYLLLCWLVSEVFARALRMWEGHIFEDRAGSILFFAAMLTVLLFSSFLCQNIFRTAGENEVNYQAALSDLFNCLLILVVQYNMFYVAHLNCEKDITDHLLYERKQQYKLSKENINLINYKCHDLKHQIEALRSVRAEEFNDYLDEVENSIMIYDRVLETDNEVLNTILSEKSLYCERHGIRLSCIVDAEYMDFMSTLDIYALLGNALDNAIECVRKYKDEEKRVVSLNISRRGDFLCIQTDNFYEGTSQMEDGLPVTTKTRNKKYHGFGMRSMRQLAEKYGGSMYTQIENGVFILQIVLPMPKEFLRLMKEESIKHEEM